MREIFELLLARAAAAFRRLPCVEDVDLLENILYSGIWLKYNVKKPKKTTPDPLNPGPGACFSRSDRLE